MISLSLQGQWSVCYGIWYWGPLNKGSRNLFVKTKWSLSAAGVWCAERWSVPSAWDLLLTTLPAVQQQQGAQWEQHPITWQLIRDYSPGREYIVFEGKRPRKQEVTQICVKCQSKLQATCSFSGRLLQGSMFCFHYGNLLRNYGGKTECCWDSLSSINQKILIS